MFSSIFTPNDYEMALRLVVAAILGAVVGFEREKSGKMAGLRTHTLVSLGAAIFSCISMLIYLHYPSVNGVAGYDSRVVSNILVGIGFIGAGVIMRRGEHIHGITTAASLWVVAAVGMAVGLGFYKIAIAATVLIYITLHIMWQFERRLGYNPDIHGWDEQNGTY